MASPSAATGVQGGCRSSRRTSPCEAERRARLPLTAESSENTGSFLPAPVRMRLNAVSWVCTDVREMRLFFSSVYGMESELKSHLQGQQLQAQAAPLHAPRSAGCPPRAERGRLSRTEPGRAPAAVPRGRASPWEPCLAVATWALIGCSDHLPGARSVDRARSPLQWGAFLGACDTAPFITGPLRHPQRHP